MGSNRRRNNPRGQVIRWQPILDAHRERQKKVSEKSGYDSVLSPDPLRADPEQGVEATTRTCNAVVVNNWDRNGLRGVTFRHRYRNDPDNEQKRTWDNLPYGVISSPALDVIYYTGAFTGFDYWWVEFTDSNGQRWTCKDNFYCYLTSDDDGTTVTFSLNGSSERMEITMNSGGCYVTVYKS
jgi:hypothetical protein